MEKKLKHLYYSLEMPRSQNKIYEVERKFPTRVGIPTNFDYFNYNKKIVQKLKNDYNVKQYTQLPKLLEQKGLS